MTKIFSGAHVLKFCLTCLGFLLTVAAVWTFCVSVLQLPSYLFPKPHEVFSRFSELWAVGTLQKHILATAKVVFLGFVSGAIAGFVLGVAVSRNKLLAAQVIPVVVALQSVPLVAFAPLFLLWFGGGLFAKVAVTALIVLFPVFTGTTEGFRKENTSFSRLFQSLGASRLQRWWHYRLPFATPNIYAGIKTSVPLALVGAVVGEFLGTDVGLGFLLQSATGLFDTPLLFVTLGILALFGLGLYGMFVFVEKTFLEKFFNA